MAHDVEVRQLRSVRGQAMLDVTCGYGTIGVTAHLTVKPTYLLRDNHVMDVMLVQFDTEAEALEWWTQNPQWTIVQKLSEIRAAGTGEVNKDG